MAGIKGELKDLFLVFQWKEHTIKQMVPVKFECVGYMPALHIPRIMTRIGLLYGL